MTCIFGISITIMSDHGTRLDLTPLSDGDPVHDGHPVPDHSVIADGDVAVQRAVVADADIFSQLDLRRKVGKLSNGGTAFRLTVKMFHHGEKGALGLGRFDHIGKRARHTLGNKGQRNGGAVEAIRNVFLLFYPGKGAGLVACERGKSRHLTLRFAAKHIGDLLLVQKAQDLRDFHIKAPPSEE